MPVIAGAPWTCRGRRYLDASLSEPIPVPTAERSGHTHVLVLLTRPSDRRRSLSRFDRWYVIPRLRRLSPALASAYRDRFGPYAALLARLESGRIAGKGENGTAEVICCRPSGTAVGKLERRAEVLKAAAEDGRRAVLERA